MGDNMFNFWDIIAIDWLEKIKKDEECLEELQIKIEYDQDYEYEEEEKETIIKISL